LFIYIYKNEEFTNKFTQQESSSLYYHLYVRDEIRVWLTEKCLYHTISSVINFNSESLFDKELFIESNILQLIDL